MLFVDSPSREAPGASIAGSLPGASPVSEDKVCVKTVGETSLREFVLALATSRCSEREGKWGGVRPCLSFLVAVALKLSIVRADNDLR